MNNIYKVIWSKAKNCYVVASEIAKSHTKSASGSEKMGGYGKKALLALAAAAAIFCGGLVNVGAVDTVHVDESGTPLTAHEVYTKDAVDTTFATKTEVNAKADNTTVTEQGTKITQLETAVGNTYTKAEADGKFATSDALNTAKTDLDGKITANTAKITANETAITNLNNKAATTDTTLTNLSGRMTTAESDIGTLKADVSTAKSDINTLKAKDTELTGKIEAEIANRITSDTALDQKIDKEIANRITSDTALDQKIDQEITDRKSAIGTIVENKNYIEKDKSVSDNLVKLDAQAKKNADAIDATNKRTAGIKRDDVRNETTIENNVTVDNLGNVTAKKDVTAKGKLIGDGVDAGSLNVENASHLKGDVTMDNKLSVTGDTSLGALNVTGESSLKNTQVNGTLTTTGKATFKEAVDMDKGLTVTSGDTTLQNTDVKGALNVTGESNLKNTTVDGTLSVNKETTLNDKLTANGEATFGNDVTVKGTTNLKGTTVDGDLNVTGTITTKKMIFGDKAHNNYTEIDQGKVTSKNSVVNGEGQLITSSSIFNAEKNKVGFANNATGDQSFHKQTSDIIMDNVKDRDNSNYRTQTKTETKDIITDKDGNSSTTSQTASENKTYLKDKDGKNTNSTIDTAKGYDKTIKGENGETSTKQDELNITNTAQKGTIKNVAMNIENNASGNITNKANTMDTNVTGKATESYGSLDTTVNGNETHIVKGTKTETVDGKVTENYGNGQETNVTGDQDIKVSGTQTTTATDINRNASSSMVDKVDNAYGTNTETKEAGKTTTDVSIKGTGEKGQYIRGANESRDYLINGTLKNSETKTVEKTSTEITDGNGKTSATIQDVNNLAGSVTNGTETGVSGIHANDNSVSIDSIVTDGNKYSVINQKKGSIQSTVVDGTNSTVILQDKDNVTIASSNGTVAIGGKDIVNNAQDTITNTAGTKITDKVGTNTRVIDSTSITDTVGTANRKIEDGKITDTAGDSTVTTENGKGTTFAKAGSAAYSTEAGATKDTNIAGNLITTGRVDANELGVSDKDGTNTADLSVKAGEGVKASAGNGTTTGSLDVKADEVVSSVKDADGKGSTFKQRIDAIMMESKDVSIKAEETLTNEAKVITNKASEVINNEAVNINNTATGIITSKASEIKNQADKLISNKVGENTWENMEDGKITTSIKDGAKQNLIQSDAAGTTQSTVDDGKLTVTIQNADGLTHAVNNGTSINASATTATSSAQTILSGSKANSVITTIDGTQFVNSEAAAPVTGASGANPGTADRTTIKGNTITTGKVTMDYAEVMKDLSVGGDVTANSYKVGDKTYIDANGINANDQKITNVADGSISEGSKDAVNGGQLYGVKRDLEHQVDKVGANAAAMANLRPMEFDPSSKWNIAAAIGNYGSETAAALGAFYRPNDDVMVNLSTAFGTGENMVGGGVSVRLGKGGNKLSREENNALKDQVNDLTARMDALLSVLNPNMSKDFPDVPENHWAYEAVSRLAGNDIVQGYPDGEFHGERTMTRYEMAEIIYNALSRGAEAERELVEEFKPELQAMAASEKATAEKAEG